MACHGTSLFICSFQISGRNWDVIDDCSSILSSPIALIKSTQRCHASLQLSITTASTQAPSHLLPRRRINLTPQPAKDCYCVNEEGPRSLFLSDKHKSESLSAGSGSVDGKITARRKKGTISRRAD